jgi:hypothetical protein
MRSSSLCSDLFLLYVTALFPVILNPFLVILFKVENGSVDFLVELDFLRNPILLIEMWLYDICFVHLLLYCICK